MSKRRKHTQSGGAAKFPTSSYMNWSVRADFPTPPLPTMITLCRAREFWPFGFAAAMALRTDRRKRNWIHHSLKIKTHFCSCVPSRSSSFYFYSAFDQTNRTEDVFHIQWWVKRSQIHLSMEETVTLLHFQSSDGAFLHNRSTKHTEIRVEGGNMSGNISRICTTYVLKTPSNTPKGGKSPHLTTFGSGSR